MKTYNVNLLLVDDEPLILETMELTLEDLVVKIYTCESAKDAIDLLKGTKIDCIVSDLNMPEINGLDFLKELRGPLNNKTPFIMYSGHAMDKEITEALESGCDDFIEKPDFNLLEETLISIFEKISLTPLK